MAASDLPEQLEAALLALYRDYVKTDTAWAGKSETPPVFIVVCNNTTTSKMVYEWIAGYCENPDVRRTSRPGKRQSAALLQRRSTVSRSARRRTILIDSCAARVRRRALRQLPRGSRATRSRRSRRSCASAIPHAMSRRSTTPRLLREVMNTVGRKGKLGEQVRCVVSVSMLTEGWDANTVTHVLGCRAFGTQLLCEQVVGRALRRITYDPDDQGMLRREYAEVLGVPFSFMPANSEKDFKPPKPRHRVFADHARPAPEIRFPRLEGYRVEFPKGRLQARFTPESHLEISALARDPQDHRDRSAGRRVERAQERPRRHPRADGRLHAGQAHAGAVVAAVGPDRYRAGDPVPAVPAPRQGVARAVPRPEGWPQRRLPGAHLAA